MLINSVVVIAIGVLFLPILRPFSPVSAVGYLIFRIIEAAAPAVAHERY